MQELEKYAAFLSTQSLATAVLPQNDKRHIFIECLKLGLIPELDREREGRRRRAETLIYLLSEPLQLLQPTAICGLMNERHIHQ